MNQLGKITAEVLADYWREKGRRSRETATVGVCEEAQGTRHKAGYNNTGNILHLSNTAYAGRYTENDSRRSGTMGSAEIGFDGQVANPATRAFSSERSPTVDLPHPSSVTGLCNRYRGHHYGSTKSLLPSNPTVTPGMLTLTRVERQRLSVELLSGHKARIKGAADTGGHVSGVRTSKHRGMFRLCSPQIETV